MDDNSRRAFSLANPPHENLLELHLKLIKDSKFTQFIINEMQEKSIHRIEAPIGQFYLRESQAIGATAVKDFLGWNTTAAGTVKIMLIEGTTTSTCFSAGSIAASDLTSTTSIVQE